ncbi:RGS13 [Acrasis kona]|uniref:RGS13 n=1 Tax=Acrasis kona TaxID=1008807 RepID=A0AAW2ZQI0_9EUKA
MHQLKPTKISIALHMLFSSINEKDEAPSAMSNKRRKRRDCLYTSRSTWQSESPSISMPMPTSLHHQPKTPLEQILSDHRLREGLLQFSKSEHNDECVLFLLELQNYKQCTGIENRRRRSFSIFRRYVNKDSDKEVNVSDSTKHRLHNRIKGNDDKCVITRSGIDVFGEIEATIGLQVADIFMRYMKSEAFSRLSL